MSTDARDEPPTEAEGGFNQWPSSKPGDVPLLAGGEADYRALIERLPIVTYVFEHEEGGRVRLRYVSPHVETLLGFPAEAWLHDSPLLIERLHDDDRVRVGEALRRRLREGERFDIEYRLHARDGRVVWVSDRDAIVRAAGDGSVWTVGTLIDVTALKEAERAVESGERLNRDVIEALAEGVAVLGADGEVLAANRTATRLLGLDDATIEGISSGRPPAPAFFEDGTPMTSESRPGRQVLETGKPQRDVIMRFEMPDGPLWLSANYMPIFEPGAEVPHGVACSIEDITERRRVAEELRETEARFNTIVASIGAVFWIADPETGVPSYVSPGFEEIWGHSNGAAWRDSVHPDDRDRVPTARDALAEGRGFTSTYRIVRPDGEVRWIRDRIFPPVATAGSGAARRVTGLAEDVTEQRAIEAALAEARERAHAAFTHAPTGNTIFSLEGGEMGRVLETNDAFCEMLGYTKEELAALDPAILVHPDDPTGTGFQKLLAGEVDSHVEERRLIHKAGHVIWVRSRMSLVRDREGEAQLGLVQAEDVTARKRSERQQAAIAELGQRALEGIELDDLMDRAVHAVTETLEVPLCGLLELSPSDETLRVRAGLPGGMRESRPVVGMDSHAGFTLASDEPVVVDDWSLEERFTQSQPLRERGMRSGVQVRVGRREAPWGVLGAQTADLRSFTTDEADFLQSVAHVLAAAIDRWEAEEQTRHRALHDALTGLPNRTLFLDRLTHALDRARRGDAMLAVLFLDIDNFKIVNDSLGHESGDALLRAFAPRLQQALRPSDTVARFGGDEFVVLCEDLDSGEAAVQVVERVLEGFAHPLRVSGRELFATASIGVALAHGGESADGMLRDADAAMYRAKARGRSRYELFDEAMRERVSDRLRTETALRRAFADDILELHYQPLVSLADGSIVGAEALLRWCDEERGWVTPDEFIPVAEDSGLIVPIGRWVLEQACREALTWGPRPDGRPLEIAVNLSARQVAQPEFGLDVERVIAETGIDSSRVTFEITESVVMEEAEAPMESIRRIEDLGVKLALDDFGTGYSSLSYLDRLPIDILKLDRSFIAPLAGMSGSPSSAIVAGVVTMAKALGLVIVAEGVEDLDQVQELRRLGCGVAQGFYFSPAVPPAEFRALLEKPFSVDAPAPTEA